MSAARPETAVAAPVVAWLEEQGWDVYQEVTFGGPIADIVATRGPLVLVVECKTSLSLDVIEQAAGWVQAAHLVFVAVPQARSHRSFAERVLRWQGVGMLLVDIPKRYTPTYGATAAELVRQRVEAPLHRRAPGSDRLRAALRPEHKTAAPAGHAGGSRWTPFRETAERVARAVAARPGITLKELLSDTSTHYRSVAAARSSLTKWIEAGVVKGVRLERDGKALRLWPEKARSVANRC